MSGSDTNHGNKRSAVGQDDPRHRAARSPATADVRPHAGFRAAARFADVSPPPAGMRDRASLATAFATPSVAATDQAGPAPGVMASHAPFATPGDRLMALPAVPFGWTGSLSHAGNGAPSPVTTTAPPAAAITVPDLLVRSVLPVATTPLARTVASTPTVAAPIPAIRTNSTVHTVPAMPAAAVTVPVVAARSALPVTTAPSGSTTAAATSIPVTTAAVLSRIASPDAATGASASTSTSAFTAGDLVISVYGNGAGDGTYGDNQASPIVLDELSSSGTMVRQMVLPQFNRVVNGITQYAVSGEYGSSSEGTLELSADGRSLVIAGYAINAATYNAGGASVYGNAALAQTTSIQGGQYTAVARAIADIGFDGTVDSSTALYGVANTNNPRSVATVDGSAFYVSGQGVKGDATQGVFLAQDGASSATAIDTSTDTRTVEISGGALYVSRDSKQGPSSSISSYGGLPTGATTATVLPGIAGTVTLTAAQANSVNASAVGTRIHLSPQNFFLANDTTLYVADDGIPKASGPGDGGLQKWSLSGGSWHLDYTLSDGLNLVANTAAAGITGLIGLTGKVVGGSVQLYATSATIGDLDPTALFGVTDTLSATVNPGERFTTLMTAAVGTTIRGVAFAPSDVPCYAAGTLILTDRGERRVETLCAGDIAMVPHAGGLRPAPIRWVGRRQVAIDVHPDPDRVRPIRIAAGAIADGVPSRPLFLSPDHALLLDGVLVAARLLVNNASITVEPVSDILYVHVALDRHDILLAENTPAESYLDTGNRHQFSGEAALALHPRFDRAEHPDACAPLATDPVIVEPIHRRLATRAGVGTAVPAITREPALILMLPDGRTVAPCNVDVDGTHSFWIDPMQDETRIELRSRSQSPADLRPWLDDRRRLGVGISAVRVWTCKTGLDAVCITPEPSMPLCGWWPAGHGDPVRWTDGAAALLLPAGSLRLDVVVSATPEYAAAA